MPARKKGYTVFAFGAKKMKGLNKKTITAALNKIIRDAEQKENLSFVIMGNVRETEKVIYQICRKNHLPIAIIPADFEQWSYNAELLRNGSVQKFFKPSVLLMAFPNEEAIEEDGTARHLANWARKNKIPIVMGCKVKEKVK
jgi:hypothetical protein